HQTGLADSGFTLNEPDRPATLPRLGEALTERRHFGRAPDQRGRGGRNVRRAAQRLRSRSNIGLRLEKLAIELPGLGFSLDPQLPLERLDTDLVLTKGRPAAALLRVQAHERPVHWLLRGIQPEQPHSDL